MGWYSGGRLINERKLNMNKIENLLQTIQDEKAYQETLVRKSNGRIRMYEAALERLRNPTTGVNLVSNDKAKVSGDSGLKSITEGLGRGKNIRITQDNVHNVLEAGDTVMFEQLGNSDNEEGFNTFVEYQVTALDQCDPYYPIRVVNPADAAHTWIELITNAEDVELYKVIKD